VLSSHQVFIAQYNSQFSDLAKFVENNMVTLQATYEIVLFDLGRCPKLEYNSLSGYFHDICNCAIL